MFAQNGNDSSSYEVRPLELSEDFDIDAGMTQPQWQNAPSVFITNQVTPNDNAPAPVRTEVKILYSRDHLYIGFICEDPRPDRIRAQVSRRDNSFEDDFVGVFIDPFNNNQQAYEFFVNPLGIQMDGMRTGNSEDMNFDALWYSEGSLTGTGYTVVMKIPFKSLNFPNRDVQAWSIQFIRNYPRSNRFQLAWTDVDINNSCLMCQNGRLIDMRDVKSINTVELLPYAMSFQSSTLGEADNPDSGLDHDPLQGRAGGSVSYSPTSTASLDAVINPDFSQVETDAAQIGINESFALFFPEKRPFFMRDADLFSTEENLFYSRMINRPLAAGKATQKGRQYTVAFLSAYDRDTPFVVPGLYGSSLVESDIDSYSNILRGTYSFGSESFVGGLISTQNLDSGHNYVGSLDWRLRLADHYYFSGQVGISETEEPDDLALFSNTRTFGRSGYDAAFNGERYRGTLLSAEFERQAKYYGFSLEYSSFAPTFQTQSGFINETDRREFGVGQSISYYPDLGWLSQGSFRINGSWRYDFAGQFQERFIFTRLTNSFGGQTRLSVNFLPLNDERFRGRFFTNMNRLMIDLNTSPSDFLSFGGDFDTGRFIRRSSDPEPGKGYNFSINTTLKPTSRLEVSLRYSYSTLSSVETSETFFSGDIFRFNGSYNFSKKLFARFIAQYDSFREQIQLYPLVYYEINPFTKFYIGMTDDLNRFDRPGSAVFDGYRETNREFFVKFQYLIRS